jgi:hypothetical protein
VHQDHQRLGLEESIQKPQAAQIVGQKVAQRLRIGPVTRIRLRCLTDQRWVATPAIPRTIGHHETGTVEDPPLQPGRSLRPLWASETWPHPYLAVQWSRKVRTPRVFAACASPAMFLCMSTSAER